MENGVWRTIRGRRVFIKEGEDLYTAMKNSGKFNNLTRNEFQKAKRENEVQQADYNWHQEYNPSKYTSEDYNNPDKRKLMDEAKEKVDKERETAYQNYNVFFESSDDYRDEKDLWYMDLIRKNERNAWKKFNELDKKDESSYEVLRESERKNARIKQDNYDPNAPYEYVDSYATFKEKVNRLEDYKKETDGSISYNENATWTGKEYTNDEFMEHLTDSNWHRERQMLEEAGLTNAQLGYIKDNTKLDRYGADLDSKTLPNLIEQAKAKFPESNTNKQQFNDKRVGIDEINWKEEERKLLNDMSLVNDEALEEFYNTFVEQGKMKFAERIKKEIDRRKLMDETPTQKDPIKDYEEGNYNPMLEFSGDENSDLSYLQEEALKTQRRKDEEDWLEGFSDDYWGEDENIPNPQDRLINQFDYMRYGNQTINEVAKDYISGGSGTSLIYYDDQEKWLKDRNIPVRNDDIFNTYVEENAKILENLYNRFKKQKQSNK